MATGSSMRYRSDQLFTHVLVPLRAARRTDRVRPRLPRRGARPERLVSRRPESRLGQGRSSTLPTVARLSIAA
jgi:hypothetical protein